MHQLDHLNVCDKFAATLQTKSWKTRFERAIHAVTMECRVRVNSKIQGVLAGRRLESGCVCWRLARLCLPRFVSFLLSRVARTLLHSKSFSVLQQFEEESLGTFNTHRGRADAQTVFGQVRRV